MARMSMLFAPGGKPPVEDMPWLRYEVVCPFSTRDSMPKSVSCLILFPRGGLNPKNWVTGWTSFTEVNTKRFRFQI